jgi:hypothetical protein
MVSAQYLNPEQRSPLCSTQEFTQLQIATESFRTVHYPYLTPLVACTIASTLAPMSSPSVAEPSAGEGFLQAPLLSFSLHSK